MVDFASPFRATLTQLKLVAEPARHESRRTSIDIGTLSSSEVTLSTFVERNLNETTVLYQRRSDAVNLSPVSSLIKI